MGRVGWLRAHSFGNLGEIGPEVWTEIARPGPSGKVVHRCCKGQRQHRPREISGVTNSQLRQAILNQALGCYHPLTATTTGTGGIVMDHGAARFHSRWCLLHPGELVIGRLTWDLPGVEPVWQNLVFFCAAPRAPRPWKLGAVLIHEKEQSQNNTKKTAEWEGDAGDILHRKLATAHSRAAHRITVVVQWCSGASTNTWWTFRAA